MNGIYLLLFPGSVLVVGFIAGCLYERIAWNLLIKDGLISKTNGNKTK